MMFYNGFNLMLDIVFTGVAGWVCYRIGHSDGYREAKKKFGPPFQAISDTPECGVDKNVV